MALAHLPTDDQSADSPQRSHLDPSLPFIAPTTAAESNGFPLRVLPGSTCQPLATNTTKHLLCPSAHSGLTPMCPKKEHPLFVSAHFLLRYYYGAIL